MISKEMVGLGTQRSVIREIFEYAKERAAVVGAENVLDFSIGNPSTPPPQGVQDAIVDFVKNTDPMSYSSYTSTMGDPGTRKAIADNLNKRYGTNYTADNFFMSTGASAALTLAIKSIVASPDDEIIVVTPFFPEYKVYIEELGAKMVVMKSDKNLLIDIETLKKTVNKNTKAIMINSPNNPSGVIYPVSNLTAAFDVLREKEKEYGTTIFCISDEPYRELVYTDEEVAHIPNLYDDTLICYSWSKSLSLPGGRIGYLLVSPKCADWKNVYAAVCGSSRVLGYVCAPALYQKVIEKCVNLPTNLTDYRKNRDLLVTNLTKFGYNVPNPGGAFYIFIESPNGDGQALTDALKKYDVLVVPGKGFGGEAFVRLAYCVDTARVEKAIPIFEKVIKEMKG